MKDVFKKIMLCTVILMIQFVYADSMRIFGVAPNIAFAFVLSIAFINNIRYNICASVILGFFLDGISGRVFGIYLFTFVVINFTVFELYHSAFSGSILVETIYGLIASFAYSVIFAFFTSFFKGDFFILFTRMSIIEWLYNFAVFEIFILLQKNSKQKKKSIFRV